MKLGLGKIKTKRIILFVFIFYSANIFAQGYNHTWLLGYHYIPSSMLERMNFSTSSYVLSPEQRKMDFEDTEGNISDNNGNFLMSSNGVWIADATNDTMQNGSGLNPGQFTTDFSASGLPIAYANLFLPMPNDTNKYVLFHQTLDYTTGDSPTIFYTIADKSLNGGLGQVISKNNVALNGSFGGGISACKHGNGRDWWITAISIDGSIIHKFLLTPDTIQYIGSQSVPVSANTGYAGQAVFSPDGEKFAFRNGYVGGMSWYLYLNLFSFDRCTGIFALDTVINYSDSTLGYGTMFSPDSKYLYFSTSQHIYQVDTDTSNVAATYQVVAVNDTFFSTGGINTNFYLMYLAANGKIYLTSTSSVLDLHEMDYPDSGGVACHVNLHNIHLNCLNTGTVPNHPNYYLGRKIGSPCDSLTSIQEVEHNFHFKIFPDPSNGNFNISYLLPQNKEGNLEILDVTGKILYQQKLPMWSTLQNISLPKIANGVYLVKIKSGESLVSKKLIVYK
jgi:hypothetical protein